MTLPISAVDTKDKILQQITKQVPATEFCTTAGKIIYLMQTSAGLWAECGYAYKGKEICQLLSDKATTYLLRDNKDRTLTMLLSEIQKQSLSLVNHYHHLQTEWMLNNAGSSSKR